MVDSDPDFDFGSKGSSSPGDVLRRHFNSKQNGKKIIKIAIMKHNTPNVIMTASLQLQPPVQHG